MLREMKILGSTLGTQQAWPMQGVSYAAVAGHVMIQLQSRCCVACKGAGLECNLSSPGVRGLFLLLCHAVCREVVGLLRELKKEATLLVVSHDLADIAPLVDCAWRMQVGNSQA